MTAWPDQPARRPLPEVPGYRVVRVIGEGGMSTVYLGTQLSLGREVAIKVMRPEALADEVSRRRFENEARTIARLEHPHIVGIHEVGRTADDLPWYSMPYLPRGHVGQRDLGGDPQRVREILRALLGALAFAHARGVIHRDVKAENVLFDEADRPLLADFGIALRRGHGTRVTMTGLAVGSTAYMAPEQARGEQVDHRADLYSVGVLGWEMLAGQLPYVADDALSMAIAHAQNPVPKLPPALADLIMLREQPEHFRLAQFVWTDVVWGAASDTSRQRALAACEPLASLVDAIAAEARASGELPASLSLSNEGLTIGPWILCLGMHTLAQQQGLLDPALGAPYRLLFKHLHYLLNGYGWQPLFDPGDDDALDRSIERLCRDVFDAPCPYPPH